MTTDHVAVAMMHKVDPAVVEAGTNRKTGKTNFAPVESLDERREAKMDKLSVILPKTLGSFKVAGIAEVKAHKKSSHVYLKLVDDQGAEPIKKIVETPENSKLYDGALTEIEQKNGLTTGVPKIVLCLRSTYWAKPGAKVRIPKDKKAEAVKAETAGKTDVAPVAKTDVPAKKAAPVPGVKQKGSAPAKSIVPSADGKVMPASVKK